MIASNKKPTKTKFVKLAFFQHQYDQLKILALAENKSLAHYCCSFLALDFDDKDFRKRKSLVTKTEHKKADKKLLFYLSNIASNVNQLAKSSNKSEISNDDILLELFKINAYIEEVKNDN